MLKKIKDKIEKIREDLDPKKAQLKKEILNKGIFNIDFFAREVGLVEPELRKELKELIEEGQIRGYLAFRDTEFVTLDYLKDQINDRIEKTFKLDLKKQSQDFGVSLESIYEAINELCSQNIQHGFFDIPVNTTFFHVNSRTQNEFISILRKGKIHLTEVAEFIDSLIESKEDIDLSSLISDVKSNEGSDTDEWESLAKDAIDVTLGKKRARIWIENLMSWNKIIGNFIEDQNYFVSKNIIARELANFLKKTGRVKTSNLQEKLGIEKIRSLKSELKILEENKEIKGYFTIDEAEYVTENKALDEIVTILNDKNQDTVSISEIKEKIGLDHIDTINLLKKLISDKRVIKLVSKDYSKFFSLKLLNKTIMDYLEKNERIYIKTINENFNLPPQTLVNHIEELIKRDNLRVIITWDKSEIINEEKILFILMEILKKSKKSLLSEVVKTTKINAKDLVRLIKYMLEFGLIQGILTNKEFTLQ
ncbi:MAG: hypothetical protein HWN67_14730 [Candidatus Helarchaeota archaeon]|nr:hypothetical protein [Candidatus Helarchaeota archaeon]